MKVNVYVTLKPGVLDAPGQAVTLSLTRLGFAEAREVRLGKYLELELDAPGKTPAEIHARVENMCRELLANVVLEDFRIELKEV